jgi:hypothetical protein
MSLNGNYLTLYLYLMHVAYIFEMATEQTYEHYKRPVTYGIENPGVLY